MIEICCGSYEDALAAWKGGAERIELNSAMYLGGLTPSIGSLRLVKENTGLKVISMVRPRGAGFSYTEAETEQMFADARILMENGSDGLAFGFLTSEGKIDSERTGRMIRLIHEFHGEAVFHRAFDCVEDPYEAIEELIRLGTDRILTSGLKEKAAAGAGLLKELQENYGTRSSFWQEAASTQTMQKRCWRKPALPRFIPPAGTGSGMKLPQALG